MFFIALKVIPKLVNPVIVPVAEVSSPIIPIPAGPNKIEIHLLRTTAISILNSCTLPNMAVALNTPLYSPRFLLILEFHDVYKHVLFSLKGYNKNNGQDYPYLYLDR